MLYSLSIAPCNDFPLQVFFFPLPFSHYLLQFNQFLHL